MVSITTVVKFEMVEVFCLNPAHILFGLRQLNKTEFWKSAHSQNEAPSLKGSATLNCIGQLFTPPLIGTRKRTEREKQVCCGLLFSHLLRQRKRLQSRRSENSMGIQRYMPRFTTSLHIRDTGNSRISEGNLSQHETCSHEIYHC